MGPALKSQAPHCQLCGTPETVPLYKRMPARIRLVRCRRCDYAFQPEPISLETIYDGSYYAHQYHPGMETAKRATYRRILKRIPIPAGQTPRILDVGCARGDSLAVIRECGAEPWGIEYSEALRGMLDQEWGSHVRIGHFMDTPFPDEFFYGIGMIDVIEHFADPVAALSRAFRLLQPEGWLYLGTPNYHSALRKLMGKYWEQFKPDHVCYFHAGNLAAALEKTGFHVIETDNFRKRLHLGYFLSTLSSQSPWILPSVVIRWLRRLPMIWDRQLWLPTDEFVMIARKPSPPAP